MAIRTPDYRLNAEWSYNANSFTSFTLPAGTFVRPIEKKYVPKHVLEDTRWRYSSSSDIYCYCRYGIVPIPAKYITKVG